jgi:hypothetical protein
VLEIFLQSRVEKMLTSIRVEGRRERHMTKQLIQSRDNVFNVRVFRRISLRISREVVNDIQNESIFPRSLLERPNEVHSHQQERPVCSDRVEGSATERSSIPGARKTGTNILLCIGRKVRLVAVSLKLYYRGIGALMTSIIMSLT